MSDLTAAIQKVLNSSDVVLGWAGEENTGVARPAWFTSAQAAQSAIFDATCFHNLAVHLPRLKDRTTGIVAKACDIKSIVQLIIERQVERERVIIIATACQGVIDLKNISRRHGFGAQIRPEGQSVVINGDAYSMPELLLTKCRNCADINPVIFDEAVGDFNALNRALASGETMLSEIERQFATLDPAGRRLFWRQQFSRCIRCYACREACPLCFCRDVCSIEGREPHWAGGETDAPQSEMAQQIRINHLAGRCTGCGACQEACPVGIPLMLLLNEQNRVVEEMFGYRAGTDLSAKPPFQTFDVVADNWDKV